MCSECGMPIKSAIFKGTGVCCEWCRKIRDGEITDREQIINHLIKRRPDPMSNGLTPWEERNVARLREGVNNG